MKRNKIARIQSKTLQFYEIVFELKIRIQTEKEVEYPVIVVCNTLKTPLKAENYNMLLINYLFYVKNKRFVSINSRVDSE